MTPNLKSWKDICKPKYSGTIGLTISTDINKALVAKFGCMGGPNKLKQNSGGNCSLPNIVSLTDEICKNPREKLRGSLWPKM